MGLNINLSRGDNLVMGKPQHNRDSGCRSVRFKEAHDRAVIKDGMRGLVVPL